MKQKLITWISIAPPPSGVRVGFFGDPYLKIQVTIYIQYNLSQQVAALLSRGPFRKILPLKFFKIQNVHVPRLTQLEEIWRAQVAIMENLPVVPHKAVAEVSRIGNYRRDWLL